MPTSWLHQCRNRGFTAAVPDNLNGTNLNSRCCVMPPVIYNIVFTVVLSSIYRTQDGSTALSIAMERGHREIALLLYAQLNLRSNAVSILCFLLNHLVKHLKINLL